MKTHLSTRARGSSVVPLNPAGEEDYSEGTVTRKRRGRWASAEGGPSPACPPSPVVIPRGSYPRGPYPCLEEEDCLGEMMMKITTCYRVLLVLEWYGERGGGEGKGREGRGKGEGGGGEVCEKGENAVRGREVEGIVKVIVYLINYVERMSNGQSSFSSVIAYNKIIIVIIKND